MNESHEQSVLQRIAAGEPDSVQLCLDRYGGLVWSVANRFCNNATDAEDAVQEVFTELWSKADRYDPDKASESTFITMIARRRMIDRLRKQGRVPDVAPLEDMPVAAEPEPAPLEVQEEVSRVNEAIDSLSPQQQTALRMAIYDNCTHSRIAEELDLPLGTVKTNIRRGLQRVRDMLKESDET